jgi:hypothetical protein
VESRIYQIDKNGNIAKAEGYPKNTSDKTLAVDLLLIARKLDLDLDIGGLEEKQKKTFENAANKIDDAIEGESTTYRNIINTDIQPEPNTNNAPNAPDSDLATNDKPPAGDQTPVAGEKNEVNVSNPNPYEMTSPSGEGGNTSLDSDLATNDKPPAGDQTPVAGEKNEANVSNPNPYEMTSPSGEGGNTSPDEGKGAVAATAAANAFDSDGDPGEQRGSEPQETFTDDNFDPQDYEMTEPGESAPTNKPPENKTAQKQQQPAEPDENAKDKSKNDVPLLHVKSKKEKDGKKTKNDSSKSWQEWLEENGYTLISEEEDEIKFRKGDLEFSLANDHLSLNKNPSDATVEDLKELIRTAERLGWEEADLVQDKNMNDDFDQYKQKLTDALRDMDPPPKITINGIDPTALDREKKPEKNGPTVSSNPIGGETDGASEKPASDPDPNENSHNDHSDLLARYEEFSANTVETVFSKEERELVQAEIAAELNKENPNFKVEKAQAHKAPAL